jgi:hypothetical protein
MVNHEGQPAFTNGTGTIYPTTDETQIIGVITSSIKIYTNAP